MLHYGCLGVGLGGVGWGNDVHVNLHTHTHTSCYVIVMFSCTCTHTSCYVMVIFSCTCSHTSCYVMVIFSCTCSHTSCYAMVIFSCTCTHTRHAHHFFCRWKPCLGVTCQKFENQTCQSVSSKQRMDQTNAKNLLFFPVHCDRDANR